MSERVVMTVMTRYCRYWMVAVTVVLAGSSAMRAQEPDVPDAVGHVTVVSGAAFIVRGPATILATLGQPILEADTLRTGDDGRIGVTFRDDTRVSLDADSQFHLKQYDYTPSSGRLGFVARIVRGIVAYVSGQIAKLSPDSVRLETPTATVGVRGTTLVFRVVTD